MDSPLLDWIDIAAGLTAWGFAFYVYKIAPSTSSTRALILLLIVDGFSIGFATNTWQLISAWRTEEFYPSVAFRAAWFIHYMADWMLIPSYLLFIGTTVRSALTRPFRSRRILTFVSLLAITAIFWTYGVYIWGRDSFFPWVDMFRRMSWALILASATLALVGATNAWITAQDSASRARAKAFFVAFGIRDVCMVFVFGVYLLPALLEDNTYAGAAYFLQAAVVFLYVPLIAYGILRTHLFDIDLRIKRTVKRSTVVAAFVAVFFLVSGIAELYLSSVLGNLLGLVCTAVLVFFLDPIQRAAERLSDTAMPNTRQTPEYEAFRKLQVYESACYSSVSNGAVLPERRPVLDSLVQSLGIDVVTAQQVEADVLVNVQKRST